MQIIFKDKCKPGEQEATIYPRPEEGYCIGIDVLRNGLADRQLLIKMSFFELLGSLQWILDEYPDIKKMIVKEE